MVDVRGSRAGVVLPDQSGTTDWWCRGRCVKHVGSCRMQQRCADTSRYSPEMAATGTGASQRGMRSHATLDRFRFTASLVPSASVPSVSVARRVRPKAPRPSSGGS
jgi:hypothetical protein